mmetsp:Transcript_10211/g.22110  ORF Transcript_10211/g.22110 Transcript_10211/m.22110 type:complete len:88 (+) Transcript_10211:673-936(+)
MLLSHELRAAILRLNEIAGHSLTRDSAMMALRVKLEEALFAFSVFRRKEASEFWGINSCFAFDPPRDSMFLDTVSSTSARAESIASP